MSFQRVCAMSEVQVDSPVRVELEGQEIVIVRDLSLIHI